MLSTLADCCFISHRYTEALKFIQEAVGSNPAKIVYSVRPVYDLNY